MQKCGKRKNKTFTVDILFILEGHKPHLVLEMRTDKVVIVGDRNNMGGLGAEDLKGHFAVSWSRHLDK